MDQAFSGYGGGGGGADPNASYVTNNDETATLPNSVHFLGTQPIAGSWALAPNSNATGSSSIAIGNNANASGTMAISIGYNNVASGANSIAVGVGPNIATNDFDLCIGNGTIASASGGNNIAFGRGCQVNAGGGNGIAIGMGAIVSILDGMAIGTQATGAGYLSAAIGWLSNDDGLQEVFSIGHAAGPRRLIHVGQIHSDVASIPGIAAGAGAGTTPTVAMGTGSTDMAGTISITTGLLPTAAAVIATITFNLAYLTAPFVILTPGNALAAALSGVTAVFATSTTGTLVLNSGTAALGASTGPYLFNYHCIQ